MSIRLIDTTTLRMKVFTGDKIPDYAILSHTWEDDSEVSFLEMNQISTMPAHPAKQNSGYQKIVATCQKAQRHGVSYAWVDTCCIDKSSSAELSEAVNSMFKWYRDAKVCYAFLADLRPESSYTTAMRDCRYWTRGWTLQELLAPKDLRFYDSAWNFVGTKTNMQSTVRRITRISSSALEDCKNLVDIPLACRMSWASKRSTTRNEDMAYCLLGIFDVNMPLLYGEGHKAFIRLQEEIIRKSNDLSILWNFVATQDSGNVGRGGSHEATCTPLPEDCIDARKYHTSDRPASSSDEYELKCSHRSVFAQSPRDFWACGDVNAFARGALVVYDFALTNNGLHFPAAPFQMVKRLLSSDDVYYMLPLNHYVYQGLKKHATCAMYLQKVRPKLFVRINLPWQRRENLLALDYRPLGQLEDAYIITNITPSLSRELSYPHCYAIRIRSNTQGGQKGKNVTFELLAGSPPEYWDAANEEFLLVDQFSFNKLFEGHVCVRCTARDKDQVLREYCYIGFGIYYLTSKCQLWMKILHPNDLESYFGKNSMTNLARPTEERVKLVDIESHLDPRPKSMWNRHSLKLQNFTVEASLNFEKSLPSLRLTFKSKLNTEIPQPQQQGEYRVQAPLPRVSRAKTGEKKIPRRLKGGQKNQS